MQRSTIEQYTLLETLGTGASAKVKLCTDAQGNKYAIKIFDLTNPKFTAKAREYLEKEIQVYQMMQHGNIIHLIEARMDSKKIKPDGQEKQVAFIVLELVTGGELFDFVALKNFSEPISRFYFRQLMQALHYVHSMGACHRDLKPENILLDKDFNIKIADFGFAAPIQGRDGSGFLSTYLGTQSYMAPEILEGQNYQGHVVDLFAAGVILFTIHAGHPPFNAALQKDSYYKLLAMNRADLFWKTHSRNKPEGFFSDEFKDLITNMLQVMPHQRLSLAEIVGHPWMQGNIAEASDVYQEFQERFQTIQQNQDQEAQKNKDIAAFKQNQNPTQGVTKKVHRGAPIGNKIFLSFNPNDQDLEKVVAEAQAEQEEKEHQAQIVCLALKDYKPKFNKTSVLFSTWKAEDILSRVVALLADRDIQPQISDKKWRLTFEYNQILNNEEIEAGQLPMKCGVQMDLLRVHPSLLDQSQQTSDDEVIAVDFSRVGGGASELYSNKFMALKQDLNSICDVHVPIMTTV